VCYLLQAAEGEEERTGDGDGGGAAGPSRRQQGGGGDRGPGCWNCGELDHHQHQCPRGRSSQHSQHGGHGSHAKRTQLRQLQRQAEREKGRRVLQLGEDGGVYEQASVKSSA
jgi:hypothetical protein